MRFFSSMLLPVQGCLAMIGLALVTLWPPESGAMLMIPMARQDANAVAKTALTGGALLLGPGPLPGSLIVMGQRSDIARQIHALDVVIVAAPPGGCRGVAENGA